MVEEKCCDEPLIKEEEGFFVCQNCGMVHDEKVLDDSPRRAFTQDEIARRKSAEPVCLLPLVIRGHYPLVMRQAETQGKFLSLQSLVNFAS